MCVCIEENDMIEHSNKIIIEGVNANSGQNFYHINWAERMYESLHPFKKQRMKYPLLMQPIMKNSHRYAVLEQTFRESNPASHQSILDSSKNSHLQIYDDTDIERIP